MENKKIELGVFAAENRKRAADFLNKTTNKVKTALDQNDDGELNLKDASDRKSTRLNSSHRSLTRMPSSDKAFADNKEGNNHGKNTANRRCQYSNQQCRCV